MASTGRSSTFEKIEAHSQPDYLYSASGYLHHNTRVRVTHIIGQDQNDVGRFFSKKQKGYKNKKMGQEE
jgi:hypothetical protein